MENKFFILNKYQQKSNLLATSVRGLILKMSVMCIQQSNYGRGQRSKADRDQGRQSGFRIITVHWPYF